MKIYHCFRKLIRLLIRYIAFLILTVHHCFWVLVCRS